VRLPDPRGLQRVVLVLLVLAAVIQIVVLVTR
jgi:hypothetical protein